MPILPSNHVLQGVSGKLGNMVLRQLNGKTIVQAAPVRKAAFRPGELDNQATFKQAIAYAKQARLNPKLWEGYTAEARRRGGNSNANAVAVQDYLRGLPLVRVQQALKDKERQGDWKGKRAATAFLYTVSRQQSSEMPVYHLPDISDSSICTDYTRPETLKQAKAPPSGKQLPLKVPLWRGLGGGFSSEGCIFRAPCIKA